MARLCKLVGGGVEFVGVVFTHRFLGFLDRRLDIFRLGIADLRAMLFESLLHVVDHGVGTVASFNLVALLAVLGAVRFGVLGHLIDLIFGQPRRRGDGDLLFVVGG